MSRAEDRTDREQMESLIDDHIEESTTHFIICDGCLGCTDDLTGYRNEPTRLYDEGFRVIENERGREEVVCPNCAPSAERKAQQEANVA